MKKNSAAIVAISSRIWRHSACRSSTFRHTHSRYSVIQKPRIDFSRIIKLDDVISTFHDMMRMVPLPSVLEFNELLSISTYKIKEHSASLSLFDKMRKRGIIADFFAMDAAINCYCILNCVDFGFSIFGLMLKSGYEPTAFTFTHILSGLFLVNRLAEAETLFEKLITQKTCETNEVMHLVAINGFCKAGKSLTALRFIEMCNCDVKAYTAVIYSLCKERKVDIAYRLFGRMIEKGIKPTVNIYNSLIDGYCKKDNIEKAWRLFLEISCVGLEYTVNTYNFMLDALFSFRKSDDAMDLFYDMEALEMIPDLYTYTIVIKGLCRNNRINEAFSVLSSMEDKGLERDIVSLRGLIHGLVNISSFRCSTFPSDGHTRSRDSVMQKPRIDFSRIIKLDDAISTFHVMVRMVPQPSVFEFNELLSFITYKMKEYSAVLPLFDKMRKRGVMVDFFTMNLVINCYCLLNRVDFGFAIFGLVLKSGYEPTTFIFTPLLRGLFLVNRVSEAETLFKRLITQKMCETNEVMHLMAINGFCKAGKSLTALHFIKMCKCDVKAYNVVIYSLCKEGKFNDACRLFGRMFEKGIKPSIDIYNCLIYGYCRKGNVNKAGQLFRRIPHVGLEYTVNTYNSMLDGLFSVHRSDDAVDLFNDMEALGMIPDLYTYSIIIKGLCRNNRIDEAFSVLNSMEEKGVEPDIVTYTGLIHGLIKNGYLDTAKTLFYELHSKGLLPNSVTYNVFLQGFLTTHTVDDAMPFLLEMKKSGFTLDPSTISVLLGPKDE